MKTLYRFYVVIVTIHDKIPYVTHYDFPVKGLDQSESQVYSIWDLYRSQNRKALENLGAKVYFTPEEEIVELHLTLIEVVAQFVPQ